MDHFLLHDCLSGGDILDENFLSSLLMAHVAEVDEAQVDEVHVSGLSRRLGSTKGFRP